MKRLILIALLPLFASASQAFYYEGRANYKTGSSGATTDHKTGGASFSVGDGGEWSYTANSSFVLQLHTVYVYADSSKATLLSSGGTSGSFVAADGLTVSWTTDQVTDKKYVITFRGTATGDPDPDPDPDPEPSEALYFHNAETGEIYNGTDEPQTYIYSIVHEDGTVETGEVTLQPGESKTIHGGSRLDPYSMSVWKKNSDGTLTKVGDYASSTSESDGETPINSSPTVKGSDGSSTSTLSPGDKGRADASGASTDTTIQETNSEARHQEQLEQERKIAQAEKAELERIRQAVRESAEAAKDVAKSIGKSGDGSGVSADGDNYPEGPEWGEGDTEELDGIGGMVDRIINSLPSLEALPVVSGRNYTYEINGGDFHGMDLNFTFDLTAHRQVIELVRILEEAIVLVMFVIACVNLIRGGFAS
ncbi:hypothetical protein H5P28_07110 [Ruficoccus amylovorans]|uniref:Uncharacterized protein n=1 Tax=Ruficoccus amylovorans TaxID=1804625 RepID=A0A842HD95_9BACT|nr:hypothetical protein [Ruficoccus amylovorans]MBC2594028.1 hypothetical protein [Ruficoccus amylovorans]